MCTQSYPTREGSWEGWCRVGGWGRSCGSSLCRQAFRLSLSPLVGTVLLFSFFHCLFRSKDFNHYSRNIEVDFVSRRDLWRCLSWLAISVQCIISNFSLLFTLLERTEALTCPPALELRLAHQKIRFSDKYYADVKRLASLWYINLRNGRLTDSKI